MKHSVQEIKLKNGARGLLIDVPGSTTMNMEFLFRAGDQFAKSKDIEEVAHILEHMVQSDSVTHANSEDFEYDFTKNGAFYNAYTSDLMISYVADCADFEWDRIMELQKQAICSPRLNEQKFDAEKGNVRSELTNYLNDYQRLLYPRVRQEMGENVLTCRQELQTINNIKLEDVREHYKRTHTTKNMRFVIAGKIKGRKAQIKQIIESFDLPKGEHFEIPKYQIVKPDPILIRRKDATNLTFGLFLSIPRQLCTEDIDAMEFLSHILTGTMHSRIFGEARKRGLTYYVSSIVGTGFYDSGWEICGEVNHESAAELFDIIAKELKRVLEGKISDKDLDATKSFVLGRHQMGTQTANQISDFYSGRYFKDGVIRDFSKIPERIQQVPIERMVETTTSFFKEGLWTVAAVSNGDRQEIVDLSEKLVPLFESVKDNPQD